MSIIARSWRGQESLWVPFWAAVWLLPAIVIFQISVFLNNPIVNLSDSSFVIVGIFSLIYISALLIRGVRLCSLSTESKEVEWYKIAIPLMLFFYAVKWLEPSAGGKIFLAVFMVFLIAWFIAVWRCAFNTKFKMLGYFARAIALVITIFLFLTLYPVLVVQPSYAKTLFQYEADIKNGAADTYREQQMPKIKTCQKFQGASVTNSVAASSVPNPNSRVNV